MKRGQEEIAWFAEQMQQKLSENEHKEHWINNGLISLFLGMEGEVAEADDAMDGLMNALVDQPDSANIRKMVDELIRECADVANFAMMIADIARRLK